MCPRELGAGGSSTQSRKASPSLPPPVGTKQDFAPLGLGTWPLSLWTPGSSSLCVTPGKAVCSGSAPVSLLIILFLRLGDIVSIAPTKPDPLSCVSALLPPLAKAPGRPLAFQLSITLGTMLSSGPCLSS